MSWFGIAYATLAALFFVWGMGELLKPRPSWENPFATWSRRLLGLLLATVLGPLLVIGCCAILLPVCIPPLLSPYRRSVRLLICSVYYPLLGWFLTALLGQSWFAAGGLIAFGLLLAIQDSPRRQFLELPARLPDGKLVQS